MDREAANVLYLLAQLLFRHAEGRKSCARLSGGHFIGRLSHHFGPMSDDELRGLSVMARELPLIDMASEDAPTVDEDAQADPAPIYPEAFKRRTRRKNDGASTSVAP
ncbi:hypothetical protein Tco_0540609 [Tanacetum coccineum]